jgi:TfoX-like protein
MSKVTDEVPVDKLELYEKLVATLPGVARKGATVPYTSVNGHMFSYLSKTGRLSLRLPEETRDEFLKKYKTTLSQQYGVVQKEYVEVPDALLKKTSELKKYFALSFAYVSSLKPKPTTRKKIG